MGWLTVSNWYTEQLCHRIFSLWLHTIVQKVCLLNLRILIFVKSYHTIFSI